VTDETQFTTTYLLNVLAKKEPDAKDLLSALRAVLLFGMDYVGAIESAAVEELADAAADFCNTYNEQADELNSGDPFDMACDEMKEEQDNG